MTHSVDPDQTAPSGADWFGFTLSYHTSVQILLIVYLEFAYLKVLLSVFQCIMFDIFVKPVFSTLTWLCEPHDPVQCLQFAITGLLEYCKDWSGTCIKLDLTVWAIGSGPVFTVCQLWFVGILLRVVPVSSLTWLCEPQDPVQSLQFANTGLWEFCKDWSSTYIQIDLTVWTTGFSLVFKFCQHWFVGIL